MLACICMYVYKSACHVSPLDDLLKDKRITDQCQSTNPSSHNKINRSYLSPGNTIFSKFTIFGYLIY